MNSTLRRRYPPSSALGCALAALLVLNAVYFLRSNSNSSYAISGASLKRPDIGCSNGSTTTAALQGQDSGGRIFSYLKEYVADKSTQGQRQPVEDYLITPTAKNHTLHRYRAKVAAYLHTPEFQQRWNALKAQTDHERGIVVAAGGKYYLPQAIVLLRVLRHHLHSTLPVELFWYGDQEMDAASLEALKKEFGPLEGYDVTKLPYPSHHLPGAKIKGFPMKPYALLHSRFKEVLLLDCDVVLARDPTFMFDSTGFMAQGNYFWGDIYGEGMVKDAAYGYVGLHDRVKKVLEAGKADFKRYAESGQLMVNRAMHLDVLEWTWFLNSFSDGHLYNFMYGDKDTYGLGFALAGKAHMYQHINMPPGGVFTHRDALGWQPKEGQMNKQGNWWLHALVHYGEDREVLLLHRVTGEVKLGLRTPKDEVITPPIPHSWSMWHMGYAPDQQLLTSLVVLDLNITYLMASSPPGQACPLMAWGAYWTMRSSGIPLERRQRLEAACEGMLAAQYGEEGARLIQEWGLLQHPARLTINRNWEEQVEGQWKPRVPLMAVPLNMTAAYTTWQHLDEALQWATSWVKDSIPVLQAHHHH